jgi:phosphoribosylformimino-5-aminoimidazole carboxamide ribotide isomerase
MRQEFELLPALDLRGGRVIRLRHGDFGQATSYDADPLDVVDGFAVAGAPWVHVVDLDGARVGEPRQLDLVRELVGQAAGRLRVELGGGLRTSEAVGQAIAAGVDRVVGGTAALRDPGFARAVVDRHGAGSVACSIDVRGGRAVGEGWREGAAGLDAAEAIDGLADAGVETFEVTAIDRDGDLGGPDLDLLGRLVGLGRGRVIASGGIASIDDVLAVRDLGCDGAIVGRALYEGRLDLAAAVHAVTGRDLA